MKRNICLLVALTVCGILYAQNSSSKHEFFVGYGISPVGSFPEPDLPFNESVNAPYVTANKKASGTFNIGYFFHVSKAFALGFSYAYSPLKQNIVMGSSISFSTLKNDCHQLMVNGKYDWLQLKQFTFYSRAGIGLLAVNKGELTEIADGNPDFALESKKQLAWQVMPVGVAWQFASNLALFAEGGAGSTGCALAGVKISF